MAERERIANHLGDIGGICNDVGFAFGQYQLNRLKELFVRSSGSVFGHRFMMDRVVPGGVAVDIDCLQIDEMVAEVASLSPEAAAIVAMLEDSESLEDRLMSTGRLTPDQAEQLGVVGYVGKASGRDFDLRRDAPYSPYDQLRIDVPTYRAGDVAARAKIRADEIGISLALIGQLLDSIPSGCHEKVLMLSVITGDTARGGELGLLASYTEIIKPGGRADRQANRSPSGEKRRMLARPICGKRVSSLPSSKFQIAAPSPRRMAMTHGRRGWNENP
jgi:Ni,Fe-hydrogenase III large subunit